MDAQRGWGKCGGRKKGLGGFGTERGLKAEALTFIGFEGSPTKKILYGSDHAE